MTIPKKIKGLAFCKKVKKSTSNKQLPKKTEIVKNNLNPKKKGQKNITIEFEDEFLDNSFLINNILE